MTSNVQMAKLALIIFSIILLISKNSIKGDRNVNQRSLQSGSLPALQPVKYFGNYPSKDEPINYPGGKEKIHQPLRSKPNPEIIPTVEKRKFFRGLQKIFHSK